MGPKAYSAQPMCGPNDWCYCTPRCSTRKNQSIIPIVTTTERVQFVEYDTSYRDYQAKLREAGWNAYNSDYVDEFPTW